MVRLLLMWCAVFLFTNVSVDAVDLRIETATGDSVFFLPVGDTVSVSVVVDSDGQALTGVELFLQYDPRAFAVVGALSESLLFGRVLIDTHRVFSDSVAVLHFAEADLVGKAVNGVLFTVDFVVASGGGQASFGVLNDDALYKSAYTTVSDVGQTFVFENIRHLTYADLPPVLQLPSLLLMKEDDILVVNLRPLAIDAESGDGLVWSVSTKSDEMRANVTDTLTLVLAPVENFNGQIALELIATDGSGGQAQGEVFVSVASVNDPPEWVKALPDSVVLTDRNERIDLSGSAEDVDGDEIVWRGQGTGDVGIEVDSRGIASIFAALDWVGEGTVFVFAGDGTLESNGIPIRVIRAQALNTLPGDFDGNGEVGFPDFLAFAQAFGQDNPSLEADLNGDQRVDFADFLVFVQNFGRTS